VLSFTLCDCAYWALTLTGTAHDTLITNLVCHLLILLEDIFFTLFSAPSF
jgi:hypothetical protein